MCFSIGSCYINDLRCQILILRGLSKSLTLSIIKKNILSKKIYNTKYKYDFHQSLIFRDRPFPLFWQDEHHQWIFWKGEPVVLTEGDKKIITIILIREEPIVQSAHSSAIGLQKAPPVGCR